MLEQIDLGRKMKRREWRVASVGLEQRLSMLQTAAYLSKTPVLILCEGLPGDGRDAAIDMLARSLDPRGYKVVQNSSVSFETDAYPWLRRFWLSLPHRGEIAIYHGGWYGAALADLMCGRIIEEGWRTALRDIRDTEKMLVDDGYVLVKLWFVLSRKAQARRLAALTADDKPLTDPAVGAMDCFDQDHHDEYVRAADEMLVRTESRETQWTIAEAGNKYYTWWRTLSSVANALDNALLGRGLTPGRLHAPVSAPTGASETPVQPADASEAESIVSLEASVESPPAGSPLVPVVVDVDETSESSALPVDPASDENAR